MIAAAAAPERPELREVRLGLVLNGGVSLAIWIGGVIREIDGLRRASDEQTFPQLQGTALLYRRLLAILQQRVVVDVIAGASAGGINGIVLGGAIFAGKPLPNLRETWIGLGDFRTLLRSPSEANPPSLMRGDEVVLSELRSVLDELVRGADGKECRQSHLYLYVTSTDLYGFVRAYHDSTGRRFEELDYRCTFNFRYLASSVIRQIPSDRLNVIRQPVFFHDPDASELLARAARSTSSFPVAFEPHRLKVLARSRSPRDPTSETGTPGAGDDRPVELRADWHWLIDGGVLDNQPFNPVLDRIAVLPPSELPTRRVVAYVVPYVNEPGSITAEAPEETAALASYSASGSLPRALSKLQSLDRVTAEWAEQQIAQDDMRRLWLTLHDQQLQEAATGLFNAYRQTRADAAHRLYQQWADPLFQEGEGVLAQDPTIDPRTLTTTAPPPGPDTTQPTENDEPWLPTSPNWNPAEPSWSWGLAPAERTAARALLAARDLQHPLRQTNDPAATSHRAVVELAGSLIWDIREQKTVLLEAFRASPATDPNKRARAAFDNISSFLAKLQQRFAALDTAITELNATAANQPPLPRVADLLHLEIVQNAFTIGDPRVPFPFDFLFMSAGCENALGHTADSPHEKLAGMKLAHFAGFLKRSWRANDWLWGRLDGTEHALRAILDLDLLPHLDTAHIAAELAHLAFPPETEDKSLAQALREAWQHGLQRAEATETPLLTQKQRSGDPHTEFVTLLERAADETLPRPDRERSLQQCRRALAARIQTVVLQEDLQRVAETAVEDAETGASKLANGYYWASRFFRRDHQLRQDGTRELDTAERVSLFKELKIGEESPKDEASSRLAMGLAAQGAAVATAMFAGNRSGLPTSVRAILATVRGITLAASALVRLLAQSPAVGAAAVFALAALLIWATVNPSVLLGTLTPALAIAVIVGGIALLTIATGTLEQPIRTRRLAIGYSLLIGTPLAFALAAGTPGLEQAQEWLHEHVGETETRVAAGLAALAAATAIIRGALELAVLRRHKQQPRTRLSWIRLTLNGYRLSALLALATLALGFVITRWHHDNNSPAGCPTQTCQGYDWNQAANEHAGTILLAALTLTFLFAAAWIELLAPHLQTRARTNNDTTPPDQTRT